MRGESGISGLFRGLVAGVVAFGFGFAGVAAQAADPVRGEQLFLNPASAGHESCNGCHNGPQSHNQAKIFNGRNSPSSIAGAVANVSDMRFIGSAYDAKDFADLAAFLGNSPSTLTFARTEVGRSSAAQTVTVRASTGVNLTGLAISVDGDFVRSGGTCAGGTLNRGLSCTVIVSFKPTAGGARKGTLAIDHDDTPTPVEIALSGTASAPTPVASITPRKLAFSAMAGKASALKITKLVNTGAAPLHVAGVVLSGSGAASFRLAASSTCKAKLTLAPRAACVAKLGFAPSDTGARAATLTIKHDAAGGRTSVALKGTGTANPDPVIDVDAASLVFAPLAVGSVTAKRLTISNNGESALHFSALRVSGSGAVDFALGGGSTCHVGTPIAAGKSCTARVVFTPSQAGSRRATLTLKSDASNGIAAVGLRGTGVAAAAPSVAPSIDALDFGQQMTGRASATHVVELRNTGSAALDLAAITTEAPFAATNDCPARLDAGEPCRVTVRFTPRADGAVRGRLRITSDAPNGALVVPLRGEGAKQAAQLEWNITSGRIDFGTHAVGDAAATHRLTLHNRGPGSVRLNEIVLNQDDAPEFTFEADAGSCEAGAALAAGGSCTMPLFFQPNGAGSRTATLTVRSSGSHPPQLELVGRGRAPAMQPEDSPPIQDDQR